MIDGGAAIWPTKTRDYVEYQQEKAYRELGDRLGDGSSPEAVYERLMSGREPVKSRRRNGSAMSSSSPANSVRKTGNR